MEDALEMDVIGSGMSTSTASDNTKSGPTIPIDNSNVNISDDTRDKPFEKWTVKELTNKCKEFKLKGLSGKPKAYLIHLLKSHLSSGGGEI